jgi:hypothetical protein
MGVLEMNAINRGSMSLALFDVAKSKSVPICLGIKPSPKFVQDCWKFIGLQLRARATNRYLRENSQGA